MIEFKTVNDFLLSNEGKTFEIPNYQRGYKWAVKIGGNFSSVERLCKDLLEADKKQTYFLQGVTVVEDEDKIILIDGQQRTTTLYFLIWYLNKKKAFNINLNYKIREDSEKFINELKEKDINDIIGEVESDTQDIYYFRKAIKQIDDQLKQKVNKDKFLNFLLNKVTVLYIPIDKNKATKTFSMMNGQKATMLSEEIIKSEMLRRISLFQKQENTEKKSTAEEWEINALRSRYAREWDKWLYWWNRDDVKYFFSTKNYPMGLLIRFHLFNKKDIVFNKETQNLFEEFRRLLLDKGENKREKAKLIFKELRGLQKSFEDIFNMPKVHNYLKLSLICKTEKQDEYNIIKYFIEHKYDITKLKDYAKWRLVRATHKEITVPENEENISTKEQKAAEALDELKDDFVYEKSYDIAIKQLLWLNVQEDNKLFPDKGRKFNFEIYGNKSLEHIHPKSKVYMSGNQEEDYLYFYGNNENIEKKKEDIQWIDRKEFDGNGTEHCIGNLVLLDKNENSEFNDKSFNEKKAIYFDVSKGFTSRNLLHTISVFSESEWGVKQIQNNKQKFIKNFEKTYSLNGNTDE